uniref:Sulfhydryl oxidase n=1 Tax=Mycena chlorophos TaxID=658473 RepID=A0ABQ0M141_MYCCL|nr:predicted protein [Mycena chlorophos]
MHQPRRFNENGAGRRCLSQTVRRLQHCRRRRSGQVPYAHRDGATPPLPSMSSKWKVALNALRATKSQSGTPSSSIPTTRAPTPALPARISEQLATELYELVIDHLGYSGDIQALLACNRVCRAWHPRSQHLLRRLLVCRPRPLSGIVHGGYGGINCAVANPGTQGGVIYGATDGVYLGAADGSRRRLAPLRNVISIEVFPDVNLFVCIADSDLLSMPLWPLLAGTNPYRETDMTRVSKHVSALSVFRKKSKTPGERHLLCVRKNVSLSATVKVFEVIENQRGARLLVTREFYLPTVITGVEFLTATHLAAILKDPPNRHGGLEVVDVTSLQTQPLLDPDDANLEFAFARGAGRPVAIFRCSADFVVCYQKFGFFLDRRGQLANPELKHLHWTESLSAFVLHGKYLLGFASMRVEVWNLETRSRVLRIHGSYLPLNMPDPAERRRLTPGDPELVTHQRGLLSATMGSDSDPKLPPGMVLGPDGKPCKACSSGAAFKAWRPPTTKAAGAAAAVASKSCPPDKDQLGNATWTFLHTAAAYYPTNPTPNQRAQMLALIGSLPALYPCSHCAEDFGERVRENPPDKLELVRI